MAESQWYLEVNGQKIGPCALDHIQGLFADGEIKGENHVTSDQLEGQWITVQELVDSLRVAAPPPPTSDFSTAPPPPPVDEDDDDENAGIALPVLESPEENSFPPSFESAEPIEEESAPPPPPEAAAVFNSEFQPPPRPPDLLSAAAAAEAAKKLASTAAPTNAAPTKAPPPKPIEEPAIAPTNDPAISMLSSLQLFKERQEKTTDTYDPTMVIEGDLSRNQSSSPRMWMVAVIAGIILGCISWGVLKTLKNKTQAPPGTMTQISNHGRGQPFSAPQARPPVTSNVTTPPNSAFRPAEGPHDVQHRMAPPRPLVAPSSAPAPVRQFEPPRDQQPQIDTAQPNEVPPQPQYAPQYQAYPPPNGNGNTDPANQPPQQQVVPQQPYVDPNNPQAPPVYPAGNEIYQNTNPGGGLPQGNPPPGTEGNSAPSVPQQVPQEQQDLMLQQQQLNQQNQPPSQ
jgi:hypothetical protein